MVSKIAQKHRSAMIIHLEKIFLFLQKSNTSEDQQSDVNVEVLFMRCQAHKQNYHTTPHTLMNDNSFKNTFKKFMCLELTNWSESTRTMYRLVDHFFGEVFQLSIWVSICKHYKTTPENCPQKHLDHIFL